MASMLKKELIIKPTSSVSIEFAIEYCKSWLDGFYDPVNEPNTTFFADIFDPRGNYPRIIRVFHTENIRLFGLTEDKLVFNLMGDPDDPGYDDDYIDEADPSGTDFILADDPLFQATQATIASNQVDFENSSEPENDAVGGITEAVVRTWVDDYVGEINAQPGGADELIEELRARIVELEGMISDPTLIDSAIEATT